MNNWNKKWSEENNNKTNNNIKNNNESVLIINIISKIIYFLKFENLFFIF